MKALKELLAIAQDASKQRNSDIIAQFKADHADELSKDKEKKQKIDTFYPKQNDPICSSKY